MITLFKWAIVDAAEMSETNFQRDAVIEAMEREKRQLAKTINELRAEVTELFAVVSSKEETIANQDSHVSALLKEVSNLQAENHDLNQEVLQLQKTTFAELPKPEKPKGGRPRKTEKPISVVL